MRRVGAPHFAPFTSWNPTGYHALNLALRCDRLTATKLVCAAHDDRAAHLKREKEKAEIAKEKKKEYVEVPPPVNVRWMKLDGTLATDALATIAGWKKTGVPKRGMLTLDFVATPRAKILPAIETPAQKAMWLSDDEVTSFAETLSKSAAGNGGSCVGYVSRAGDGGCYTGDLRLALSGRKLTCARAVSLVDALDVSEVRCEAAVTAFTPCDDADDHWPLVLSSLRVLEQAHVCDRLGCYPLVTATEAKAYAREEAMKAAMEAKRVAEEEKLAKKAAAKAKREAAAAAGESASDDDYDDDDDDDETRVEDDPVVAAERAWNEAQKTPEIPSPMSMHYALDLIEGPPEEAAARASIAKQIFAAASRTPWRSIRNLRVNGVAIDDDDVPALSGGDEGAGWDFVESAAGGTSPAFLELDFFGPDVFERLKIEPHQMRFTKGDEERDAFLTRRASKLRADRARQLHPFKIEAGEGETWAAPRRAPGDAALADRAPDDNDVSPALEAWTLAHQSRWESFAREMAAMDAEEDLLRSFYWKKVNPDGAATVRRVLIISLLITHVFFLHPPLVASVSPFDRCSDPSRLTDECFFFVQLRWHRPTAEPSTRRKRSKKSPGRAGTTNARRSSTCARRRRRRRRPATRRIRLSRKAATRRARTTGRR